MAFSNENEKFSVRMVMPLLKTIPGSQRKVIRQKVLSFRNCWQELHREKRCNTGAKNLWVRDFSTLSSETAPGANPRKDICRRNEPN